MIDKIIKTILKNNRYSFYFFSSLKILNNVVDSCVCYNKIKINKLWIERKN